jgi:WD40 repeat protein/serine/threonine protein kinase
VAPNQHRSIDERDEPVDEEFASRLAAIDERILTGNGAADLEHPDPPVDSGQGMRLARAEVFLQFLDHVWPRAPLAQVIDRWDVQTGKNSAGVSGGAASTEDHALRFGRFRIVREVGRGGFGIVFLAIDPVLRRQVALKVPRPEVLLTPALRQRLLREAQAAAGLDHPNVVAVYEAGELGPICYIVSAFCTGEPLSDWLASRQGDVSPLLAARLVMALADAAHHAHSRGVLHRDIKPGNVLLAPLSNAELDRLTEGELPFVPLLADFGLAKVMDRDLDDRESLTPQAAIIGTPSYMAPEQVLGRQDEIGPRSDVYSLGAILYEILTGQPPLAGETESETLLKIVRDEPLAPCRVRPDVPRDLEAICLCCLEKDPGRRYLTAADLSADLQRYLDEEPTHARPLSVTQRGAKWSRKHPAAAILVIAALIALAAIPLGWSWFSLQAEASRRAVILATQRTAIANDQRHAIERRTKKVQQQLYTASLKLAHVAWKNADTKLLNELLSMQHPDAGSEDLRGFAWHYLWRQCHGDPVSLLGHQDEVYFLTFAANGEMLASASRDGTVCLWNSATGRLQATLRGHDRDVRSVAFSPDGQTLASASDDRTVKIWDIAQERVLNTLSNHIDSVFAVAFSPDGKTLATAGKGRRIRIWDTATWQQRSILEGHAGAIRSLAFSRDGKILASGSDDSTCRIWDWGGKTLKTTLQGHQGPVSCVSFSPDDLLLATSSHDRSVKLWNVADASEQHTLEGHTSEVNYVQFAPDKPVLASVGNAGNVRLWDIRSGELKKVVMGHPEQIWCAAFSPKGDVLATAGADDAIRLWSPHTWQDRQSLAVNSGSVRSVAFAPGGKMLATGSPEGPIRFWDFRTGKELFNLPGHTDRVSAVAFSADGNLVASGSDDKTAKVWDLKTKKVRFTLPLQKAVVSCVAFSPDGNLIATGNGEGTVQLWDAETARYLGDLTGHVGHINALTFSPNGKTLAAAGDVDEKVMLWDVATRKLRWTAPGSKDWDDCVAFSLDGSLLAVGSKDGVIRLWDAQIGSLVGELRGHRGGILSVSFSPDGNNIASGSADSIVKIWSLVTRQELMTLEGHAGKVKSVVFSPDGRTLVSGSESGKDGGELFVWLAGTNAGLSTPERSVAGGAN